jgi:hypothetical protein
MYLALGIVFFLAFILILNPQKIFETIILTNLKIFALALVLDFIVLLVLTIKFKAILSRVYGKGLSFSNAFKSHMVSNMFGLVSPAKSGEVVKAYILKKRFGIDYSKGLVTVIIERVSDLIGICFLIILIGSFIISESVVGGFIFSTIILLLVIVFMVLSLTSNKLIHILLRFPFLSNKLERGKIEGFQKDLKENLKPTKFASLMLIGIVAQLFSALRIYVIFISLGKSVAFFESLLIFFVTLVIGILTLIPGGLGSMEISGSILYSKFLGLDLTTSVVAIFLLRLSTYIVDLPLGLISGYSLNFWKRKNT